MTKIVDDIYGVIWLSDAAILSVMVLRHFSET